MGELKGDGVVTPLLIGRIFEESDIILLLHSDDLEALDDYLIKNVRKTEATQELVVVPIYESPSSPRSTRWWRWARRRRPQSGSKHGRTSS